MAARDNKQQLSTPRLDEPAMAVLAAALASKVKPPLVIFLEGDLGAGKTTFVRAFIHSLGYRGKVKSPTYGLLENYPLERFEVVHLDLYRIEQSGELEFLGLEDFHQPGTVFMVEWPRRGGDYLPDADLSILFKHCGDRRILEFAAHNEQSEPLIRELGIISQ